MTSQQPEAGSSPTAHLDLRIPRLRTLPGFVDYSYTKVKLAPGMFKTIRLEPWDDFENLINRTKDELERLDPVILASIKEEVGSIRRKIEPSTRHENADFQDALQRLFASSQVIASTPGSSSATGSTQKLGALSIGDADYRFSHDYEAVLESPRQRDTVYYTNTSSCARINSKVFDLVESLIKYVRRDRQYVLLSEMQLSSEIGKRYEGLLCPKDFCNIAPDIALTRKQEHPARELPICYFELKGPLRSFWRLSSEDKHVLERPPKKPRSRSSTTPQQEASSNNRSKADSLPPRRQGRLDFFSAKGLADFYNEILSDSTLLTRKSNKSSYYYVFLPVAQAVIQALLTESGCSALYTHQEAILFKVYQPVETNHMDDKSNDDNRPIRVRVSRAFSCDDHTRNICSMVSLANHSCDNAASEKRKREVRQLFNQLTHGQYEHPLSKVENCLGPSGSKDRVSHNSSASSGPGASKRKKHPSKTSHSSLCSSCHSSTADSTIRSSDRDDDFTQALAEITETNEGVIGLGSSAIVLRGIYKGRRVAVKSWNGLNREGLRCLFREVEIYRFLLRKGEGLLGVGIPYVRIARAAPEEDEVLVTDRVGETVKRTTDGKLLIAHGQRWMELHQVDIEGLGKAALHSLKLLHDSNILHGDVSLPNLRAQRRQSRYPNVGNKSLWRAWWIDLGLSQHCSVNLEMEMELEDCVRLFPEANIDSIISTA